jgi:hypothetical protein
MVMSMWLESNRYYGSDFRGVGTLGPTGDGGMPPGLRRQWLSSRPVRSAG